MIELNFTGAIELYGMIEGHSPLIRQMGLVALTPSACWNIAAADISASACPPFNLYLSTRLLATEN